MATVFKIRHCCCMWLLMHSPLPMEPFWCLYAFSSVMLPIPYMMHTLPALRRRAPYIFLGVFKHPDLPLAWCFMLSKAGSDLITYALAFPFWVKFANQVPVRSSPVLHVRCKVVQKNWGMSMCTKVLLRAACARARQAGSHSNISKSYPDQRHCGIAAVVLSATGLSAE